MQFEAQQLAPPDEKLPMVTRDTLNAILSKVPSTELRVYAKEQIDFKTRGRSEIEAAEDLGIHKMISGTVSTTASDVSLEVHVVDIKAGGFLEHTFSDTRPKSKLVELQHEAAEDLLVALHIQLTSEGRKLLFANRTTRTQEDYEGLYDSLPFAEEKEPMSLRPAGPERPEAFAWGIGIAHAEEAPSPDKALILELLRQYREALEAKSVDRCAELQVEMNERQRDSLRRYFDNAGDLRVQISGVDIAVEGTEALATFTRTDQFTEVPTGVAKQLEVRLSSLLTKQDGRWKIRGLKRPS